MSQVCFKPWPVLKHIKWANFHELSESGMELSKADRAAFDGLCKKGVEQIYQCYSWVDKDLSPDDVAVACSKCPYRAPQGSRNLTKDRIFQPDCIVDFVKPCAGIDAKAYVYFITDNTYVKIGSTKNVKTRLEKLQTGNPNLLSLICAIPFSSVAEAKRAETVFHDTVYPSYRKRGEWFDLLHHISLPEFQDHWQCVL